MSVTTGVNRPVATSIRPSRWKSEPSSDVTQSVAVGSELGAAISDLAAMVADRRHPSAGEVDEVEVRLGDLQIFDRDRAAIVMREIGEAPAAARNLRDQAVGRGIARVDHVEIGVGAVAPGRAVADPAGRHGSRRRTCCGCARR